MSLYKTAAKAITVMENVSKYGIPAAGLYALYKGGKKKRDKHALRDSVIVNAVPTAISSAVMGHALGGGRLGYTAGLGALGALYGAGLGAGTYLTARGVRGVLDDK